MFCQRNPKPCPLIHVLEPGVHTLYNDVDVRSDCPRYRIYKDGVLEKEVLNIAEYWRNDFVTFVIGCSFSFEDAMVQAGLNIRHINEKKTVPMYNTNIPCKAAGAFQGNMVVSMRPFTPKVGRLMLTAVSTIIQTEYWTQ